jgi:hypothetical protein
MERELIRNLLSVAAAYQAAHSISRSTLGRQAAGDWRFFDHLSDETKTFTAKKYDQVMGWFSDNWPAGAVWPATIARPQQVAS